MEQYDSFSENGVTHSNAEENLSNKLSKYNIIKNYWKQI